MSKKYRLLKKDTMKIGDRTLYRIEALRDFSNVKKGDKGGYIEKEANLSHYGNAWVYDDALVYGNAMVSDNARVYGNALVSGDAIVSGLFDLTVPCDFELKRIKIDTEKKLKNLKKFLDNF